METDTETMYEEYDTEQIESVQAEYQALAEADGFETAEQYLEAKDDRFAEFLSFAR